MSTVLSLWGAQNPLVANICPPLEGRFEIGFSSLEGCNTLLNVTAAHNVFYYNYEALRVPEGSYTVLQLSNVLSQLLMTEHRGRYDKTSEPNRRILGEAVINITFNHSSKRVEVFSTFPLPYKEKLQFDASSGFPVCFVGVSPAHG